jgi:crotonobetaine/carnitine-CoA ligase
MTNDPRAVPAAQRTLPDMLRRQAVLFGSRPLLRIAGRRWSHADAADAAGVRAGVLAQAGVQRGDRIAVMCGNRIEFLETFLGAGWIGASTVPVNTASMGPQIGYSLAHSEARLLVIEAGFLQRLHTADLAQTKLEEIWVIGEAPAGNGDAWRPPASMRVRAYPAGGPAVPPADVQPGDPLAILYTSGTTGPAKGVVCPHAQYFWWGVNSAEVLGVGADDVLCTTLPLFHINALNTLAQAALTGAEVVFETRFRLPASGLRCKPMAPPWSTCSAPWCRYCLRNPRARRSAVTACAPDSALACPRRRARHFSSAPVYVCSKAMAPPKPTLPLPQRPPRRAAA